MKIKYTGGLSYQVFGKPMLFGEEREFTQDEAETLLKLDGFAVVKDEVDTRSKFSNEKVAALTKSKKEFRIVGESGKPIKIVTKKAKPAPKAAKPKAAKSKAEPVEEFAKRYTLAHKNMQKRDVEAKLKAKPSAARKSKKK